MPRRSPQRAAPRASLADLLRASRDEIVDAWELRARETAAGRLLSGPALRDHVPQLLDAIADALASGEDPLRSLAGLPDLHALDRLREGYEAGAVASELAALREVVLARWTAEAPPSGLAGPEVQLLNRALDAVVVRSVERFTRARERTLLALDRVSAAALGTGDGDAFLPRLLEVLLETTPSADAASVLLRDEGGDVLRTRAVAGTAAERGKDFAVRIGEGFAGEVARRRQPMLLHDASSDPLARDPAIAGEGVRALFGVPLVHGDRVIGVAQVASRSAHDFSEEDQQLFRTMAQRATSIVVQAQLVTSRARALDALEHGDAFLLLDRDFRVVLVNATQERLSRRPRAETLGRVIWELWPETAAPASRYWQEYHRCMRERVPVAFVENYAPLDLWTEVTAYPSPEGGIAVFFRDISAQRRAEAEQLRRKWELDELFANTPDLVAVAGFDGRFRRVNAAFTEVLGFAEQELLPRPFIELVHPDDRGAVAAELARLAAGERTTQFEIRCLRKQGGHRWISWNASPDSGRLLFFAAGRDVTERKARADFERDLVGIVSHDLKNPLTAVLLASASLRQRADLDGRTLQAAVRIHSAAERSLRLVGDLLDFTRARVGGGIPLAPRPVDAHAVVRRVVDEVRVAHAGREVRLEWSGRGEGEWDPDRLAQLLANLVVNALTYGPPGQPVTVRSRADEGGVTLEVHNLGAPIPPEQLPHLFEPYRRGEAQGGGGSLGLGLFIAHEIARSHRGSIDVRSSPEKGTTFTVRLPRARAARASPG